MGSSSSSYAPKTIYLDVDGKVQKVGPNPVQTLFAFNLLYCLNCLLFIFSEKTVSYNVNGINERKKGR